MKINDFKFFEVWYSTMGGVQKCDVKIRVTQLSIQHTKMRNSINNLKRSKSYLKDIYTKKYVEKSVRAETEAESIVLVK